MLITEDQVVPSELVKIFNSAFIDTSDIRQDKFTVQMDRIIVYVILEPEFKFIRYSFHSRLNNISLEDASTITNKMNNEFRMLMFCSVEIEGNVFILVSYTMSYKKGMIKYQLVDNIKLFEKIAVDAIVDRLNDYL